MPNKHRKKRLSMASQTFKGEGRIKTISNKRDLKKIISHLCLSQETARGGTLSKWENEPRGRCQILEPGAPASVAKE